MAPHWSQMDVPMAPATPVAPEPHVEPVAPVEPESEEVAKVEVEVKPTKKVGLVRFPISRAGFLVFFLVLVAGKKPWSLSEFSRRSI